MGSDEEETEQSPPPIPPRTSSVNIERPLITLPNDINGQLNNNDSNSDSSNSTSSDAPDLLEDTSENTDTDSDDSANDNDEEKMRKKNFDANSSLPPIPNGTLDLNSPADKQKFSSDEERYARS